jgi:hypothetical protein
VLPFKSNKSDFFKSKYIEPYHYEEIVEERFLSKLCGYPICWNELENVCLDFIREIEGVDRFLKFEERPKL